MFTLRWTNSAQATYTGLKHRAESVRHSRRAKDRRKSSPDEGLFKQVHKTLLLLQQNPRHPSLQTHEYSSIDHPFDAGQKVFEAYAQNRTPGAYRIFWCYGPQKQEITVIAITPHP